MKKAIAFVGELKESKGQPLSEPSDHSKLSRLLLDYRESLNGGRPLPAIKYRSFRATGTVGQVVSTAPPLASKVREVVCQLCANSAAIT